MIGETAQLVAELDLRDKLSGKVGGVNRALGGLDSTSRKAGKSIGVLGTALGVGLGTAAVGIASRGVKTFIGVLQDGVVGAQELEAQQAQTQAAIKSTGGVAKVDAEQVRALAEEYEGLNATIDDKVIQSAENMLLTFTNVDKKAFQPALQAALDMNTRFGGGEAGLQSTMVQVGKALQDPIKGVGALRRVGVQLTEQQAAQVKTLVKNNDLYGAQKIILGELNKEFGGSFIAQGDTSAGKAAKFTDALDDMKIALAQGVLPGLDRVRDRLTTVFTDPKTVEGIKDFGTKIADFLSTENIDKGIAGVKGLFGFLKTVPWGTIGAGLSASAQATKAVVEAFLKLPPGVQTAIVGGLAVNKLSGGMLGGLAGKGIGSVASEAVKFLFKKGDTPANPLFVADVSGGLGGAGGAVGAAGGAGSSIAGKLGKFVLGPAAAVIVGAEIAKAINDPVITPAKTFEQKQVTAKIDSGDLKSLQSTLTTLERARNTNNSGDTLKELAIPLSYLPFIGDALGNLGPELDAQIAGVKAKLDKLKQSEKVTQGIEAHGASEYNTVIRQAMLANSNRITHGITSHAASEHADLFQVSSKTALAAERMTRVEAASTATAANTLATSKKNFSPTLNVDVRNAFSISNLVNVQKTYSYVTSTGRVVRAVL